MLFKKKEKREKKDIPYELRLRLRELQNSKNKQSDIKYSIPPNNNVDFASNIIKTTSLGPKFKETLISEIDKRNYTDKYVYKKAHIDRRLFSKIINDKTYHPSKNTVICLGLALELNIEDFNNLLQSANYSMPNNEYFNIAIKYCIEKKIYDIDEVNDILYACELHLL